MTLYELTEQFAYLQSLLEDCDEEQIILDTLEGIEGEIEVKAEGYAKVMKGLEAQVNGLDEEIKRLTARKKTITNNIDTLKNNLYGAMLLTGKTKFKTDLFSFAIQKNPPSCEIIGEVPEKYLIPQEPKVDKKAIIEELKATGDTEFAKLVQGESLRIK